MPFLALMLFVIKWDFGKYVLWKILKKLEFDY